MTTWVIGRRENLTTALVRSLQGSKIRLVEIAAGDRVLTLAESDAPQEPTAPSSPRRSHVLGIEFVSIPMGVAIGARGEAALIEDLWFADFCITNAQWDAFVARSGYDGTRDCQSFPLYAEYRGSYRGTAGVGDFDAPDVPAVCISWQNAAHLARWLTAVERAEGALGPQFEYRLPTEVEWEYACRASTKTAFSYGDESDPSLMNYGERLRHPTRRGMFPPNRWGLYDMHGNVFEWCDNLAGAGDLHSRSAVDVPGYRANRGGSWASAPESCTSSYRHWNAPDVCHDRLGARLVLGPVV